jgi:hypothetical protein
LLAENTSSTLWRRIQINSDAKMAAGKYSVELFTEAGQPDRPQIRCIGLDADILELDSAALGASDPTLVALMVLVEQKLIALQGRNCTTRNLLDVHFLPSVFNVTAVDSSPPVRQKVRLALQQALRWLFPEDLKEAENTTSPTFSAPKLYKQLQQFRMRGPNACSEVKCKGKGKGKGKARAEDPSGELWLSVPLPQRIPGLMPELRPYQRRAVQWMLARELGPAAAATCQAVGPRNIRWSDELLWIPLSLAGPSEVAYFNPHNGALMSREAFTEMEQRGGWYYYSTDR